MFNIIPAMVMVPVRLLPVAFSETLYTTSPFPVPELPVAMEIHEGSLLVAVHEQAASEGITETARELASLGKVIDVAEGEIAYVHSDASVPVLNVH